MAAMHCCARKHKGPATSGNSLSLLHSRALQGARELSEGQSAFVTLHAVLSWALLRTAVPELSTIFNCTCDSNDAIRPALLSSTLYRFSLHSYAASHQPFILVPGANHAQTSNGVPNYARGDIPPTVEYATATEQLSHAIASFVTSHQAVQKNDRQAAADELLVMVRRTAEMLGPYFMASGMFMDISHCRSALQVFYG